MHCVHMRKKTFFLWGGTAVLLLIYSYTEPLYTPTAIVTGSHHHLFPTVIAHKALISRKFQGNSFSAIREAVASTVDGIEVDVRMSKDGVLFLYHGETLEESTDHNGIPEHCTWQELLRARYKNNNEHLVKLETFLDYVGAQKTIFLDIKSNSLIDSGLIQTLVCLIKKRNLQESVVVESFNPITLMLLRLYARDMMIMYDFVQNTKAIGEESQGQFDKIPWLLTLSWMQKQVRRIVRPDILGPRFNTDPDHLKALIYHGYLIVTWTVDDVKDAVRLHNMGVKGFQTNRPLTIESMLFQET